ncbi:MAG: hypothetical protein RBR14_05705 [Candidatus Cloacimonas acidaminovorans]|jgi:hypothetical protein|nr:hypothetical protein [Candidatus Cloacimonas acidaminovorans]
MQNIIGDNEFITEDINIAGYLLYLNIPIEYDRKDPQKVKYIFTGNIEFIVQRVQAYNDGETQPIVPRRFQVIMREIKKATLGDRFKKGYYNNENC